MSGSTQGHLPEAAVKRFCFRLESLLRYRQYLERKSQLEVARVRAEIMACERRIDQLKKDAEVAGVDLAMESEAGVDAGRFLLFTNYLSGIDSVIAMEDERRKTHMTELVRKQKVLAEKSRDKKMLDNLKERRKTEYYQEMLAAERKEADDTVILRKAREIER
jgi:flagellar protein FliJ